MVHPHRHFWPNIAVRLPSIAAKMETMIRKAKVAAARLKITYPRALKRSLNGPSEASSTRAAMKTERRKSKLPKLPKPKKRRRRRRRMTDSRTGSRRRKARSRRKSHRRTVMRMVRRAVGRAGASGSTASSLCRAAAGLTTRTGSRCSCWAVWPVITASMHRHLRKRSPTWTSCTSISPRTRCR